MQNPSDVLTPDAFRILRAIAQAGSFAGAARAIGVVPSALTYRVRQIEDALDVLLFDRSSRQAVPTAAGAELLRQGERLRGEVEAVVNRVKRMATGWEPQLTIAVDGLIAHPALMELACEFFNLNPPTRLRIRDEILSGTVGALASGRADLALGAILEPSNVADLKARPLGTVRFVYAVAPHHPLAQMPEPLSDAELQKHRAVVVSDSTQSATTQSFGLIEGQDSFVVSSIASKLDAQLRGLGSGFLAEPMARPYLETGRLVARQVERSTREVSLSYAWRASGAPGKALEWWLEQLDRPITRRALLEQHRGV
ncbi:LysR family transcriptional regulator [Ottowia thiooxydans]|uniref:LysR family transcriptional regulator n=1 Tax=Ottowia thiooxydans TaxID=219182 RepID=UPI0004910B00|nr:LysR family transcriptional regulator [Ottowia thiooxydans]